MAWWKWSGEDTQRETGDSKRNQQRAWHQARDDSGREKTSYDGPLRDPSYKDSASREISGALNDAGITDIQSTSGSQD